MADGQHGDARRNVSRGSRQTAQPAIDQVQVFDATGEAHLATQAFDTSPKSFDDGRQAVAAQVRPGVVENRRLALALGEQLQHPAHLRAGVAIGQLAVAEGAGAALAKQIIALRVEWPALIEGANIADAIAHGPAPLQNERSITLFRQEIGGHETPRTRTDDDRPMRQRLRARRRQDEGRFLVNVDAGGGMASSRGASGEAALVLGKRHLGGVNELQRCFCCVRPGLLAGCASDRARRERVRESVPAAAAAASPVHPHSDAHWRCAETCALVESSFA